MLPHLGAALASVEVYPHAIISPHPPSLVRRSSLHRIIHRVARLPPLKLPSMWVASLPAITDCACQHPPTLLPPATATASTHRLPTIEGVEGHERRGRSLLSRDATAWRGSMWRFRSVLEAPSRQGKPAWRWRMLQLGTATHWATRTVSPDLVASLLRPLFVTSHRLCRLTVLLRV